MQPEEDSLGAAPKAINKRTFERHPVTIKAKVRPIGKKEWEEGILINLSKSGTCIESSSGFFIGQMLEVMVPKQGGVDAHKLVATVIWKRGQKHGLNFL